MQYHCKHWERPSSCPPIEFMSFGRGNALFDPLSSSSVKTMRMLFGRSNVRSADTMSRSSRAPASSLGSAIDKLSPGCKTAGLFQCIGASNTD